jgi:hypothetical protein
MFPLADVVRIAYIKYNERGETEMLTIQDYRRQLRDEHGIDTRPIWATGKIENDRFSLHAFLAYGPDGDFLGPIILQELDGGRDGILTYIGAPGNTIASDSKKLLDRVKVAS